MKKRLFLYTTSIVFAGLIIFFAMTVYITSANNLKIAKDTVIETTHICADLYSNKAVFSAADISAFVQAGNDTRITIISAIGEVIADSRSIDVNTAENHLSRPEIQAALNDSPEPFVRYSYTIGTNFIYYAVKINSYNNLALSDNYVFIRTAVPVEKIDTYLFQSLPSLVLMLCIVALMCFLLISSMSTQILKPFGFVEEELRLLLNGEYVQNPVNSNYDEINKITRKIDDVALILQKSINENRESARRREEFFSNASHELKTPLTAIKGFNELTEINNKDDRLNKFITGISRETDRMLSLIGDMLKLSEIESKQNIKNVSDSTYPASISLKKVANEAHGTLSSAINKKAIRFNLIGNTTVNANYEHVYELVKNLIENAVRYNNQCGRVSVAIKNDSISVSDTGIGILPEEQTRIFERFYRVEKSRSQLNGGTGLGLSIVKHICELYGWSVSLKSKYGAGTEITVEFNKKISKV